MFEVGCRSPIEQRTLHIERRVHQRKDYRGRFFFPHSFLRAYKDDSQMALPRDGAADVNADSTTRNFDNSIKIRERQLHEGQVLSLCVVVGHGEKKSVTEGYGKR